MASTASEFPGLTDTDRYLLRRAAAERGVPVTDATVNMLRGQLDALLPGVRQAFDNRAEFTEAALRRRGTDPDSPEFKRARRDARSILAKADRTRQGRTA